jgi:hypothetical protein
MSLIDLCGINNLRWGSNPRYVDFPTGEVRTASTQPKITKEPQEIESQKELLNKLESFLPGRMISSGQDSSLHIENHKSA